MQKKIIALAVAGLVSGAAFAQSNVTIYGVADVGMQNYNTGFGSHTTVVSGQNAGSRIGFKGEEALGNGLKALFVLEAGVQIDTGSAGGTTQAYGSNTGSTSSSYGNSTTNMVNGTNMLFGRQAFAGLASDKFGSVTFGRQYSPMYSVFVKTDTFGLGSGATAFNAISAVPGYTTRLNNSVAYSSPTLAGFSGVLAYATAENNTLGTSNATGFAQQGGQVWGTTLQYENGPLFVGFGYHNVNGNEATGINTNALAVADISKAKAWTLGSTYDFKVVKLFGVYTAGSKTQSNAATENRANAWHLGVGIPFGASTVSLGYSALNVQQPDVTNVNDFRSYGARYTYDLSKRTKLYTAYTKGVNKGASAVGLSGAADSTGQVAAGFDPRRFELGVAHSF